MLQFNLALQGKWLWRKLVYIKYGSMRGSWGSKEVGGPYGVGAWKCIRGGWLVQKEEKT
jgi:hypothetical protein